MAQTDLHGFSLQEKLNKRHLDVITVTATTDAEQINQYKVVAQSIEIPFAFSETGGTAMIQSLTLLDEANTTMTCDVVFSSVDTAISGDEGKAVGEDVSDLDSALRNVQGHVSIVVGDYIDLIDARVATKSNIQLAVQAAAGSMSLYMHIINQGSAVTFGATTDVKVKIGIMKD